jgi:plasmid stabilization system protein ParE
LAQLSWSLIALDDLQEITARIELESPLYAALLVQRVFDAAEQLETFPRLGRVVPEYAPVDSLRELLFQGYRIIYRFDGEVARVLIIIHAVRDLASRLGDEPWIVS